MKWKRSHKPLYAHIIALGTYPKYTQGEFYGAIYKPSAAFI